MNLTEQEMRWLKESKSESEWNDACDVIKLVRKGEYPPDWFVKVLLAGVPQEAEANWKIGEVPVRKSSQLWQ
jgi:hypothetical protein